MPEFLVKLFMGLIPQKDDDAMKLYAWRWKSVCLGVVSALIATYAASFLPFLKPPYAMAATLVTVQTDLQGKIDLTNKKMDTISNQVAKVLAQQRDGQIQNLNTNLIEAMRYKCRAQNSEDQSALPFWTDRVQRLKIAYQKLAMEDWPDMDCKSF